MWGPWGAHFRGALTLGVVQCRVRSWELQPPNSVPCPLTGPDGRQRTCVCLLWTLNFLMPSSQSRLGTWSAVINGCDQIVPLASSRVTLIIKDRVSSEWADVTCTCLWPGLPSWSIQASHLTSLGLIWTMENNTAPQEDSRAPRLSTSKVGGCKSWKRSLVTGAKHICGGVFTPNLLPVCASQLMTTAWQPKGNLKEGEQLWRQNSHQEAWVCS